MKNLKKLVATVTLMGIIIIGVTNANAGILIGSFANKSDQNPCTSTETKVDSGILIGSITGILIGSITGILIGSINAPADETTDCGILIGS